MLLFQVPDYLMPWLLIVIKTCIAYIRVLYSSFRRTDLTTGDIYLFGTIGVINRNRQDIRPGNTFTNSVTQFAISGHTS